MPRNACNETSKLPVDSEKTTQGSFEIADALKLNIRCYNSPDILLGTFVEAWHPVIHAYNLDMLCLTPRFYTCLLVLKCFFIYFYF